MLCPLCMKGGTCVVETRESTNSTRRRRECLKCGNRFTTYERYEEPLLTVVKKDGRVERYSRKKVLEGILTACQKRPVEAGKLEKLVNEVERELLTRRKKKIPTIEIGKLVLKRLKRLDDVAYVRFASVYLNFSDLETFKQEINALLKEDLKRKR